jgi:hypothetical protein
MSRASEWRDRGAAVAVSEAVELVLPSGATILARRPDAMQLASWNKLPMSLAAAASGEGGAASVTTEQAGELAGFLRDLLVYCCVAPRISLTPGEDEMHPRDVPQADWTFIINWALRVEEARSLTGFRGGRADAGDSGDGEGVRATAF